MSISQWAVLDTLEIPFLVLSGEFAPLRLSSDAARILKIKQRHDLTASTELLRPLIEIARQSRITPTPHKFEAQPGQPRFLSYHELQLRTVDNRVLPALCYARDLQSSSADEPAGIIVVFYDLSLFTPYLSLIEQTRNLRLQIIEAAARKGSERRPVDLMSLLNKAVAWVDRLILSTVKVGVDASTSALLDIDEPEALVLISHLLLEAADYASPAGKIKVNISLDQSAAEIVVLASRSEQLLEGAGPLARYLYRSSLSPQYKVGLTAADDESAATGSRKILGSSGSGPKKELLALSPDGLSENMKAAGILAERYRVQLKLRRSRDGMLTLCAEFPLSTKSIA